MRGKNLHHLPGSRPGLGSRTRLSDRGPAAAGSTTLELVFAIAVLLVGLLSYSRSLVGSVELGRKNRDTAVATEAARTLVESLYATPFDQVFATFNGDPSDDPGGAGTAPGAAFLVPGLDLRNGDPDGMHGQVLFPTDGGALREDLVDDVLGMPRDLDLDGAIDGVDHAGDYRLLPVLVRVEWRSGARERLLEIQTLLADR